MNECPHCEMLPYAGKLRHEADCPNHVCEWGPFEQSRLTGQWIRWCVVPFCKRCNLDGDDD